MQDPHWVAMLPRVKTATKYEFIEIHVLAPHRKDGVAPVVLRVGDEYLRAPVPLEAAFELCLRHLHCMKVPWPNETSMTILTLLADRATEALQLPARFIPAVKGVTDLEALPDLEGDITLASG